MERSLGLGYQESGNVVLSTLALVTLALALLAIAMVLLGADSRPLLFRQERAGQFGRGFRICKFRTMSSLQGADGPLLREKERVTGLGRWLRRTSPHELPEFFNVVAGDRSLVGPRPLLVDYLPLPLYDERERRRHDVRPGVTGLAQVLGRNRLNWPQRAYDIEYVDNWTLWLDFRILMGMVPAVLRGRETETESELTSELFGVSSDQSSTEQR